VGSTLLVNPDLLRGFAQEVDTASTSIASADVGRGASQSADGLPGSSTQWAAALVGAQISSVQAKIATGIGKLGAAVRGAGDRYEVEDADLAQDFDKAF